MGVKGDGVEMVGPGLGPGRDVYRWLKLILDAITLMGPIYRN